LMIFSSFAVLGSISSATTPPYTVTFNEANLPVGTTWGIILYDVEWDMIYNETNTTTSTGGSIVLSLYNGTYYFDVIGTPWWFNDTPGMLTVAGADQTITINFIENFTLNISETGWTNSLLPHQHLASGYTLASSFWSVKINDTQYSSTNYYNNIKLPSGTYNISFPNATLNIKSTGLIGATYPFMVFVPNITQENITLSSNQTLSVSFTPYIIETFTLSPTSNMPLPTFYNSPVKVYNSSNRYTYLFLYNSTIHYSLTSSYYIFLNATTFTSTNFNSVISDTSLSSIMYNNNHTFVNITIHVYGPFNIYFNPTIPLYKLKSLFAVKQGIYLHKGMIWNASKSEYIWNIPQFEKYLTGINIPYNCQNATTILSIYPNSSLIEYGLNVSIPIKTISISSKVSIYNNIIYFNGTIFNFNVSSNLVSIQGYVYPNDTTIYNFYAYFENTLNQNITNGYYNVTVPAGDFLFFYNSSYIPQVVRVTESGWLNISLQRENMSYNISSAFSYDSTKGGILNFTKIPVNASIVSSIIFKKISSNKFYISAYFSYDNLWNGFPYAPLHIILPVLKDRKYLLSIQTNISTDPYYNFTFYSGNNSYYNFSYNMWSIDPLISYYAYPVAVITAPSVVAYDSAIAISGANSIASENATITNWTWKITGPQGQLYIKYGKTITQYFSIAGIYTITLTVTDSNGLTNTTTTTINVVSASQDLNIKITYTLTVLSTGYYEYDVTVYAQDNVSISQFLASVDSVYVNATFIKQVGYAYYYQVVFNPNSFGYGNHTIKFEAVNTLNGYNTLIVYATFGSVNKGGIIAYIFGHLALTIVILIFIAILISFIYVLYENRLYRKIKHSRRVKVRRR
ncbi:MAG: PKD domain-containing protein, partial [Thermoprotei archaeon]